MKGAIIIDSKLQEGCFHFGLELTPEAEKKFELYSRMLIERNKSVNLTAITDPDEIISKHFVDSVSCQSLIKEGASLIDVGTGAGFPGIPLKIVRNDLNVTLLDSLEKRVAFLRDVCSALSLGDITSIHSRAEDGAHTDLRESFDVAVARAVANLSVLSEYCLPYVKPGGIFIALKGPDIADEAEVSKNALKILGGEIREIKEVYWEDFKHTLVIIDKITKTPTQYPRKAGKPSKNPL